MNELARFFEQYTLRQVTNDVDVSEQFADLFDKYFPEQAPLCSTCPSKTRRAFEKLQSLSLNKYAMKPNSQKYTMKKGVLIDTSFNPIAGVPTFVNADNLTDAIAEKLIASSAHYASKIVLKKTKHSGEDAADTGEADGEVKIDGGEDLDSIILTQSKAQLLERVTELKKLKPEITFDAKSTKKQLAEIIVANS